MEVAIQELKTMSKGLVLCNVLLLIAAVLMNFLDYRLILGMLVGNSYAVVNFCLIGSTVDDVMEQTDTGRAKRIMQRDYAKRFMFTAVVIIFGLTVNFINPLGVILPLFFPKITLYCSNIFFKKGGENK